LFGQQLGRVLNGKRNIRCGHRFYFHLAKEKLMAMDRNTENLISSDKQSGKAVYGAEDKKIGSIECVMVDKSSGQPAYAVLSIGGFLGMGDDHYPVPWKLLRYDSELDGYRSDISGNRLKGAPKHGSELFDWTARRAELDDYYNDEVIRPG
jgi:hypothetical protein